MEKLEKGLTRIEIFVASLSFALMVCIIAINVFSRYIFKMSFAWAEEIAYMAFNWTVYFGICLVYNKQGMISIDVLVDRLPKKAQHVIQVFVFGLVGVINIALVIWGMRLSILGLDRLTSVLKIPYFWIDLSIPLACLILAYYSFRNLVFVLQGKEIESAALEDRS